MKQWKHSDCAHTSTENVQKAAIYFNGHVEEVNTVTFNVTQHYFSVLYVNSYINFHFFYFTFILNGALIVKAKFHCPLQWRLPKSEDLTYPFDGAS
jgi:hypothetical protein